MLNPFPIMFLSLLAHTILRVVTGSVLIYQGVSRQKQLRSGSAFWGAVLPLAFTEIVIGIMFFVGFLTQIAALLLLLYALGSLILHKRFSQYFFPASTQFLLISIALSLCITGAGAFAFDIPL